MSTNKKPQSVTPSHGTPPVAFDNLVCVTPLEPRKLLRQTRVMDATKLGKSAFIVGVSARTKNGAQA